MAYRTPSISSESSSTPTTPVGSLPERILHKMFGFGNLYRRNQSPTRRRIFRRDVEEEKEELQYASTLCLSSYYSVFVVRLAIMVCMCIYTMFLVRFLMSVLIVC